ncbi:MAG: ABC transporter permease [Novosphingobium sp.]|uniref:ABC transporter permease n=1 Tax=Novosphingobium sp. TaxID=1874826 RepID=UPI00263701A4|nr:ABC transporter permease [Novosphingobium sp.]MCP5387683.1 ABC transporter permease [Novosphingobium sp.]
MREWADFTAEEDAEGALHLAFSGPLEVSSVGPLDDRLRGLEAPVASIDLSAVPEIDTVGAWIVWRLARDHGATIKGADARARRLIDALRPMRDNGAAAPPPQPLGRKALEEVGAQVDRFARGGVGILEFYGALLVSLWTILRGRSPLRVIALVRQLELTGVSALPIIGLMSFLVGIVIAQQGAVQLEDLGFGELTVNLTGRISLRELGILMTAIMFAGRSGSSFAAQIGTMKLTEEIDAMRTIGVSPMEALVVPRVLASVLMMPLLGFYSAVIAIIGGAFISTITLDIPFMAFLTRVRDVVPMHDVWVGLVKGPFFGFIVAMAGCYQGMQVKGNSEEVGLRTTIAVVQAIFAVIVLDAFFAVFFTEIGWG